MQSTPYPVLKQYLRPMVAAVPLTVPGATLVFLFWGLRLHPDGQIMAELVSSAIAGLAMAVAIGLMVGFIVGDRYEGTVAATVSSLCYAIVSIAVILVGYEIDMEIDHSGIPQDPALFAATVVMPFLATMPLYGWLLHSRGGKALLSRFGL
jgi:hypothetical protein